MFDILIYSTFAALAVGCAYFQWQNSVMQNLSRNADFSQFQRTYLFVYLAVMMADWVQGPYLYRLYEEYGFLEEQIAALYIAGAVSSMLFGPSLGGLADKYGRRKAGIVCCALYSLSCLMKVSASFYILLLGRVLGGLSTSLLFSTFESWMVAEHNRRGFPSDWLPRTFALATFGNGVVAASAGVVANIAADFSGHNPVRPFLVAILFLALGAMLMRNTWVENIPESTSKKNRCSESLRPLVTVGKIWRLGAIQALFEGAMYMFVFLWTASLDPPFVVKGGIVQEDEHHPPLGVIFGSFMLAIMLGSAIFRNFLQQGHSIIRILHLSLLIAVSSLAVGAFATSPNILFPAFVAFEFACGLYFPAMGTLRGEIIPEEHRAGIMNWFRVPLNFIVVVFLFLVGGMERTWLYTFCALLCGVAVYVERDLNSILAREMVLPSSTSLTSRTTITAAATTLSSSASGAASSQQSSAR